MEDGEKTQSRKLAERYLELGGKRRSKIDDNITQVRQWQDDPPEAERFWADHIAILGEDAREEVEFFLPDINNT